MLKNSGGADDIAIIGMACRFPGVDNYNQFWHNLEHGINAIREIPPDRWDVNQYYSADINEPNKSISKWCGLIDGIDEFDNTFFNISPREAKNMDPQQRLLLEETWHCIEDSGVHIEKLRRKRTAVYIGVMASDYRQEASRPGVLTDGYAASGNYDAMLANRISYAFGFSGASVSVDAACASSLVAIDGAKRSLLISESDYAIAGAVSLNLHPWKYLSFSKAGMLSPDGQCKTFDADANGYVPGEGIGVLLLQRLEDAQCAGNHIFGIIKGCAVNHGGRTRSLTAPRVEAQRDVILLAYQEADISPETVSYVEAHGTGTSLGDPIEIEALTRAFRRFTDKNDFCKIGSVKSNIGHLEAAAGIAGVIKVLMMMQHHKIPKSLNIKSINPIIQFDNSPFSVAKELGDWDPKTGDAIALRAGVSSFGMGGVNAHILLEQAPPMDPAKNTRHGQLFVLSAKTRYSLNRMLTDWKSFIATEQFPKLSFKDICRTMLTGRDSFANRFGVYAEDKDSLKEQIALAAQSAVAVQPSAKFYCLRIGSLKIDGYSRIEPLLRDRTIFSECLKQIRIDLRKLAESCQSFKDLNMLQELEAGFEADNWMSAAQSVYAFMVDYAYAAALIKIGAAPGLITGAKEGALAGLASCGIMRPIDALALLTHQMKPQDISLRRPTLAFLDPVSGKIVEPFRFSSKYMRFIRNELRLDPDLLEYYLEKAQLLFKGQFTFKRYMQEWNSSLKDKGKTVDQMLFDHVGNAPCHNEQKREKLLILVIIISSLHKLRLKWDLTQQKPIVNQLLSEVVDLIVDGVMSKRILVQLFMDDQPDLNDIASALCKNYFRMDLSKPYHYIRTQNRGLKEIDDVSEWLTRLTSSVARLPQIENMVCVDLGENDGVSEAVETVTFQTGADLDKSLKEFLLQLWLHGVHIEWPKIFPDGRFNKVPLPVYAFDRKSFWLNCDDQDPKTIKQRILNKNQSKTEDYLSTLYTQTEQYLTQVLARLLELSIEDLDSKVLFKEYGVDSIMIHHFNAVMEQDFESLSKTLLFEYQTIHDLAGYLVRNHEAELCTLFGAPAIKNDAAATMASPDCPVIDVSAPAVAAEPCFAVLPAPGERENKADDGIAIIGLSGIYPGAKNLDEFWRNLKSAKNCVTEIPRQRWSVDEFYDPAPEKADQGKMYCKWGAFLDDVEMFDPLFFNISPRQAELMDPQERMFLETAWRTLEDAGYTSKHIRESIEKKNSADAGVFVGVTSNTYCLCGPDYWRSGSMPIPTSLPWSIANRVSYVFNFQGPSIPIDTACSSSLTAIHMACQSIRNGECSIAIAGGVNLYLHPAKYVWMCQMGMLSSKGRCASFGDGADGFAPGEGVGAMLLKPFKAAVQDGDNIYAVIKGSAMNHGGSMHDYMVPNPNAQAHLISKAIDMAGFHPGSISYLEAQGIGSELGDSIEITGLKKAYAGHTTATQYCAIGSLKSNIGHLEAAAGIAGMTKVLLQIKNKQLVPSLHAEKLNPNIDFGNSPFFVQRELTSWNKPIVWEKGDQRKMPRRAGVSSFGAGGINAHVVLEEYDYPEETNEPLTNAASRQLIVLSAKNEQRLNAYAEDLSYFLKTYASEPDRHLSIENIAYTLQVGRESMDARLAVIAEGPRDLCRQLDRYLEAGSAATASASVYTNLNTAASKDLLEDFMQGRFGSDFIDLVAAYRDLRKLALLWVSGADIQWEQIHKDCHVRRVSLPCYPFDRLRCWICGTSEIADPHEAKRQHANMAPHPEQTSESENPAPHPMRQTLVHWISELLKIPEKTLEQDRCLREYGFNSRAGMRLIHRIAERFEIMISPSKLFEHQTITALSEFLSDVIAGAGRIDSQTVDSALEAIVDQRGGENIIDDIDVDRLTDGEVDELIVQLLKPSSKRSAVENGWQGQNGVSPEPLSA